MTAVAPTGQAPPLRDGPRVLVVAPLYHTDRGGLGRQAVLLTECLADLGVRPLVATRLMRGLPARAASPRVEVVPIPAGRPEVHNYEARSLVNLATSLRFTWGLARLLERRRRDVDLLHVHGASLPLLGVLPGAALRGKKVVAKVAALHQGVEAGDLRGHYGPVGPLLARALRRVDAFVATTAEIEAALEAEGYRSERIARIPNFVETDRFRPPTDEERRRLRRELDLGERPVVLHSGRLTPRKNVDVLLDAFARARARAPEAILLVLGDGPERPRLEAQARGLGLAPDHVRFLGFRADVERVLQAGGVFALASSIEGLPNALLEAMGCGLAPVATRIGGALEAIPTPEIGLLVPPRDPVALGEALARVLTDGDLRERLGRAAAARIRAAFALDAIAPRYVELYGRLLKGEAAR